VLGRGLGLIPDAEFEDGYYVKRTNQLNSTGSRLNDNFRRIRATKFIISPAYQDIEDYVSLDHTVYVNPPPRYCGTQITPPPDRGGYTLNVLQVFH
jgi:hypothetical protein